MYLCMKVIAAEGEQKASRALKEAADVIQESPSALQVKQSIFSKVSSKTSHIFCSNFVRQSWRTKRTSWPVRSPKSKFCWFISLLFKQIPFNPTLFIYWKWNLPLYVRPSVGRSLYRSTCYFLSILFIYLSIYLLPI